MSSFVTETGHSASFTQTKSFYFFSLSFAKIVLDMKTRIISEYRKVTCDDIKRYVAANRPLDNHNTH